MSDLRPKGIEVELGGQKRNLLFTINAIDEIQESCNLELWDAMEYAAKAAVGNIDHDTIVNFRLIVKILWNDAGETELTEKEVGQMLTKDNYVGVAKAVMRAFGVSIPDPDDEEDREDDDPKAETGQ